MVQKQYNQLTATVEKNGTVAGRYRIQHFAGLFKGKPKYSTAKTMLTFASTNAEGKTTEGIVVEDLVVVLRDYLASQADPNNDQIQALDQFLAAGQTE